MKKILFLVITVLVACKSEQRFKSTVKEEIGIVSKYNNPNYKTLEELKGDTLKYLQINFLSHKKFYIGKPLNVLLNDLEIDVKKYANGSGAKNINLSPYISLGFYSRNQERKKIEEKQDPLVLNIEWEVPLPDEKNVELLRKNKGQWTEEEKNYYGQNIVKEIEMVIPNK